MEILNIPRCACRGPRGGRKEPTPTRRGRIDRRKRITPIRSSDAINSSFLRKIVSPYSDKRQESGPRSLDSGLRRSDGAGITIIFPLRSHRADSLIRGVQQLQARRHDWDNQAA